MAEGAVCEIVGVLAKLPLGAGHKHARKWRHPSSLDVEEHAARLLSDSPGIFAGANWRRPCWQMNYLREDSK